MVILGLTTRAPKTIALRAALRCIWFLRSEAAAVAYSQSIYDEATALREMKTVEFRIALVDEIRKMELFSASA